MAPTKSLARFCTLDGVLRNCSRAPWGIHKIGNLNGLVPEGGARSISSSTYQESVIATFSPRGSSNEHRLGFKGRNTHAVPGAFSGVKNPG